MTAMFVVLHDIHLTTYSRPPKGVGFTDPLSGTLKANASKASIYTEARLDKQLDSLEKKITEYQQALAEQDAKDDKSGQGSLMEDEQLQQKLVLLKEKQIQKKSLLTKLKKQTEKQLSTVDPDARLLYKRGQTVAGYNAQIVVDSEHKLIVAEEVTQDGNDSHQLSPMLEKAQEILESQDLTVLADSGYYEGNQLKACEEQNITVFVAIPNKSKFIAAQGRFTREQFKYDEEQNCYICPQGNSLKTWGKSHQKNNKWFVRYRSTASECRQCPLREQCLTKKARVKQLSRWEFETVIERHKQRMTKSSDSMKKRGALVEHPFGTLKNRAGINQFLMRGLEKCRGEFSLMVLGYNFTRVLNILGTDMLRDYCVQRSENRQKHA